MRQVIGVIGLLFLVGYGISLADRGWWPLVEHEGEFMMLFFTLFAAGWGLGGPTWKPIVWKKE